MNARDAAALGARPGRSGVIEGSNSSLRETSTAGKSRPPAKIERVLAALIAGPKTTRELELSPYYDHCANATAHDLKRLDVQLEAERIELRGYGGLRCWCARYRIRDEGMEFAKALLQRMRERRHGHT